MVALGTTTVLAAACGDDDDGDAMVTPAYGTAMTSSAPGPSAPVSLNLVPMYGIPITTVDPFDNPDTLDELVAPGIGGGGGTGMGGSSGSPETPVGSPDAGAMSDAGNDADPDASTAADAGTPEPEVEPFDDGGLDPDNPEPSVAPLYGLPSLR